MRPLTRQVEFRSDASRSILLGVRCDLGTEVLPHPAFVVLPDERPFEIMIHPPERWAGRHHVFGEPPVRVAVRLIRVLVRGFDRADEELRDA